MDSAKLKMDVITTTDIDAWGTMTTPLGSFEALRMYTIEESSDSMWFKMGGFWTFYQVEKNVIHSYSWWSDDNATGYILVEFDYTLANDSVGDVTFLNSTPTQSIDTKTISSSLSVYPNPTSDYINFNYDGLPDAEIEIYDIRGKFLRRENILSKENLKLSVENYPGGIYFYNLVSNNGKVISTGKFCKK